MANPNFNPTFSSNDIWRDEDATRCLTDDLDQIEAEIEALGTDKADSDHTHTEYADANHSHSGYALSTHSHTGYASTSHTHSNYAPVSALPTASNGDVSENLSNKDVLAEIANKSVGMYTFYAISGSTNNPKAGVSWRYLVHKTVNNYAWVMAYGSDGSVYSNYLHGGTWQGWKVIYDNTPTLVWQHPNGSGSYMTASQTITPSKKLSECAHGWVLVWSDFDATGGTSSNADLATTFVPKKMVNGANWSGQSLLCIVPVGMTETADNITLKRLYISDDSITGHAHNSTGSNRIDVVLRCIYEI